MSVVVAGLPQGAWCTAATLVELGEIWRFDETGGVVCDAPGIYVVDGTVRFVLPRCYAAAIPEGAASLRAALLLLRTMARYRLRPNQHAVDGAGADAGVREKGDVNDVLAWLEVALLLVEDAERHGGLTIATSKVSARRQGRIHWPTTQQRGFHIVDGAEVMTSPLWQSRRDIDPEDALTRLHLDTCGAIRASLGQGVSVSRPWTQPEALSVLNRRERALFADRHRLVARWLRQYWTSAVGTIGARRSGVSALWAPSFPLVWEVMLREVLGGRPFGMPPGTYRLADGVQRGLRLIPDFVVDADQKRFIVDAKHYALDDLPRSESLAKQLLYRWFASRESGHGKVSLGDIVSVFVLPAVGRRMVSDVLGCHTLDGEEGRAFGQVWVVAADFETVAAAYLAGQLLADSVIHTVAERLSPLSV